VLIVGAGGETRGVIAPLLVLRPAELVVANRTADRAEAFAAQFADLGSVRGCGFEDIGDGPFDVVINATSASLSGEVPGIPASVVLPETVCYDMAYGRHETSFLKWAREQGCIHAVQGLGMLVEQAAESFQLWRGVRPQTAPVLAALRERLSAS
jgi:shikimate dehydrogenase